MTTKYFCVIHEDFLVNLPNADEEFLSGKFHNDIERCKSHLENYSDCKFRRMNENV
jgi:hypothetical protein